MMTISANWVEFSAQKNNNRNFWFSWFYVESTQLQTFNLDFLAFHEKTKINSKFFSCYVFYLILWKKSKEKELTMLKVAFSYFLTHSGKQRSKIKLWTKNEKCLWLHFSLSYPFLLSLTSFNQTTNKLFPFSVYLHLKRTFLFEIIQFYENADFNPTRHLINFNNNVLISFVYMLIS